MGKRIAVVIIVAIIVIIGVKSSMGNELATSRQLILVVSDSWADSIARVFRFEKTGSDWIKVGRQLEAVVGSNGMAWGIGLHRKNGEGPVKKEGDRKAPAGVFQLIKAMGYEAAAPAGTSFPYEQIIEKTHCVDDQTSSYYNKIVNEANLSAPAKELWMSSEIMKRKDILYKWLVVVDHNVKDPKAGAGSCIFIHVWRTKEKGTAGCTAMEEKNLIALLSWLKQDKAPLLVQLPKTEYERYWKEWKLPSPTLLSD